MPSSTDVPRYNLLTRVLHWLIAAVILGLVGLGWWMVDLTYYDRWYNRSLELHKSAGLVLLAVVAVFVAWALVRRGPPLPDSIPRWQRIAAHATHGLLFVLMLAMPVTGYLISTSAGAPVSVFGLFEVPALVNGGEPQENGGFLDGLDTTDPSTGGLSNVSLPTTALAATIDDGHDTGLHAGQQRCVFGQHGELTFHARHNNLPHFGGENKPLRRHQLKLQEIGHPALR